MTEERTALYIAYTDDKGLLKEIKIRSLPDTINYSKESLYKEQTLLGRLSPVYTYERGSEEFYTFAVTLHEDDLIDKNKTLKDFVDDILKVNYPYGLGSDKPKIIEPYFQIGDLKGQGIIDVQVTWNTPFREGKYIYATLSFTITVIEDYTDSITKVDTNVQYTDPNGATITIDKMYTTATLDFFDSKKLPWFLKPAYPNGTHALLYSQTEGDLQNFISGNLPESVRQALETNAINKFDNHRERIKTVLEKLAITEEITDTYKNMINIVESQIAEVNVRTTEIKRKTTDTWASHVAEAIKEYYKNNRNILPEERDMLIKEIDIMFRELRFLQEEVFYYGATS